ncbi:uncharacterized protein LOC141598750 [Silene latifolia]|uniref:uncharacterized protein LOC141598750 n=1 Tax=Silene latifolia TaxID=37657 RepID=UPI003D7860C1
MGANSSTPQNPNPENPPTSTSTMASISPNSQNPDPKTLENQNPDPKTLDNQIPEISDIPTNPDEKGQNQNQDQNPQNEEENNGEKEKEGEEGEGEEEGECGFCLFMKGGGCKDAFINWENCVEEAEKNKEDIVEKCAEITGNLKNCMEAHAEYYEPILRAEKVADEEVKKELEREEAKKNSEGNDESKVIEETVDIEVEKLATDKA